MVTRTKEGCKMYQNCKFQEPCGNGSGARASSYLSYSNHAENLKKYLTLMLSIIRINLEYSEMVMIGYTVIVVNFRTPGQGFE